MEHDISTATELDKRIRVSWNGRDKAPERSVLTGPHRGRDSACMSSPSGPYFIDRLSLSFTPLLKLRSALNIKTK